MGIRIITDSASDVDLNRFENAIMVPLHIHMGDEDYLDGETITHDEFYTRLAEEDIFPQTSQPNPFAFERALHEVLDGGDEAIVITVSGGLSGTYESALSAVTIIGAHDRVYVHDTGSASLGETALIEQVDTWINEGFSLQEIKEKMQGVQPRLHVVALLDTLEYLKRGGRISKTQAALGGMLNIKPIITTNAEGRIEMAGKARGMKNATQAIFGVIEKLGGIDATLPLWVGYTGLTAKVCEPLRSAFAEKLGKKIEDIPVASAGATIGCHGGPGCLIVGFFSA